jgi:RNA polymerase sigma-70 factor (ECF subfamily)
MANHPFEEHIPRLRRYARALLRDAARADDLVQDTLERALHKFALFRHGTDLRAWLFTIMHNVHVNQIRTASNRAITVEYQDTELSRTSIDDATALRDLANALERLAPEHREVLVLVGVEQFSYEETARVLDVPIGTVMSRLSRARDRLASVLAGASETAPPLRRVK